MRHSWSFGTLLKLPLVAELLRIFLVLILEQSRQTAADVSRGLFTRNQISGFLGSNVVIQCAYNGTDDWVFVRWKRISKDKHSILATLLQNSIQPVFSAMLRPGLRRKLSAGVRYDSSVITFYMEISSLDCDDAGQYECDVSTFSSDVSEQIQLSVQAYPEKPNIAYDVLVVEVGQTFSLHCEGNVGYPPGVLQWYIRSSHHDYFRLVDTQSKNNDIDNDNINSILTDKSRCSNNFHAEAYLNITVHQNINGASIRCAVKSAFTSPADSKYYDEVTIKLPEFPSTPATVHHWNPRYSIFGGDGNYCFTYTVHTGHQQIYSSDRIVRKQYQIPRLETSRDRLDRLRGGYVGFKTRGRLTDFPRDTNFENIAQHQHSCNHHLFLCVLVFLRALL